MEFLVGIALAFLTFGIGRLGLDRDRAFYPTVGIVVASYYVLFESTRGGGAGDIAWEAAIATAFTAIALLGFTRVTPGGPCSRSAGMACSTSCIPT